MPCGRGLWPALPAQRRLNPALRRQGLAPGYDQGNNGTKPFAPGTINSVQMGALRAEVQCACQAQAQLLRKMLVQVPGQALGQPWLYEGVTLRNNLV